LRAQHGSAAIDRGGGPFERHPQDRRPPADRAIMSRNGDRTRLSLAALPFLALALLLPARALLWCHADGEAPPPCCPQAEAPVGHPSATPRLSEPCCCETVAEDPSAAMVSAVRESEPPTTGACAVAVAPALQSPRPGPLALLRSRRAPRPPKIPLFVLNRTLLI
jgi:hypothetical protein